MSDNGIMANIYHMIPVITQETYNNFKPGDVVRYNGSFYIIEEGFEAGLGANDQRYVFTVHQPGILESKTQITFQK